MRSLLYVLVDALFAPLFWLLERGTGPNRRRGG